MDRRRTVQEVIEDHLEQARDGRDGIDTDLARNYAEDVVVLTREGVFRGHDAVRKLASRLQSELPDARFAYVAAICEGEMGLVEWTAEADGARVRDGVDSFLVRDGQIVGQTIHYTVVLRETAEGDRDR